MTGDDAQMRSQKRHLACVSISVSLRFFFREANTRCCHGRKGRMEQDIPCIALCPSFSQKRIFALINLITWTNKI